MTNDLILFLRVAVGEEALMRAVARLTGMACASEHFPDPDAPAFFVLVDYNEGFASGFSLSWPQSLDVDVSAGKLARDLADEFQSDVLFDLEDAAPGANGETWRIVSPGTEEIRAVAVKALDEGFSL